MLQSLADCRILQLFFYIRLSVLLATSVLVWLQYHYSSEPYRWPGCSIAESIAFPLYEWETMSLIFPLTLEGHQWFFIARGFVHLLMRPCPIRNSSSTAFHRSMPLFCWSVRDISRPTIPLAKVTYSQRIGGAANRSTTLSMWRRVDSRKIRHHVPTWHLL